jgi:hypothetical protein
MTRRIALGVAFAATIVLSACSAATVPSAAPTSPPPAAATPSGAPLSSAPTVAAPSVAAQSPARAATTQRQVVHVLENPLDWADVKVGSLAGCADAYCLGDYEIGSSSLIDAVTKKPVGTLLTECFLVDAHSGRYHCPATTLVLTGRGQIVFTEDPYLGPKFCPACFAPEPPNTVDYPVIGGTGEFLGATGDVTGAADSTWQYGDFVVTLTR